MVKRKGEERGMTFWVTDIGWRVAFYCERRSEKEEREGPVNLTQGPREQECC